MKKFILSCLIFVLLTFNFPSVVKAEEGGNWYNQGPFEWYSKVYDEKSSPPGEIFGERYTAAQVQWILYSLFALPINAITGNNTSLVACMLAARERTILLNTCGDGIRNVFRQIESIFDLPRIRQGANQSPFALVFNTENRPLSGIAYVKYTLSKFSLIPEAKAQEGFGFGALGVVLPLWRGVRNVAYAIFALVIIVFSFMIMFRVKISPQVVISVQSALPKVIIALILATFSYAIAGFMVDLMYVFIGFFSALVNTMGIGIGFKGTYNVISGQIPLLTDFAGSLIILVYMFVYDILFLIAIVMAFVGTLLSLSLFGMLASILMVLVLVWAIILTLWYTIKIPWMLIKALVQIFLLVIVAPLQIALGTLIPPLGFGAWLKNLIANLLVFPVTGTLFYLAITFLIYSYGVAGEVISEGLLDIFSVNPSGLLFPGKLWSPPLLASGADMSALIFIFMSFGIIILIPKAADFIKAMVTGERFTFGTALGEATAPLKYGWELSGAPIYLKTLRELQARTRAEDISAMISTRVDRTNLPPRIKSIIKGFFRV
ncbi:MAG: hypothetical protein ACOYT7_01215 [Patescibacteria group bacterium]